MEIAPQPIIIRLQPDMILGGTRLSSTAALSAAELGLRPLETTEFFTAFTPLSNESFLANSLPLDLQIAAESAFCTPALFSYLPQLPPADQFIRSAQPMNCAYPSPVIESDSLGDTDDFAEFVTLDGDEHPQLANALEEKSAGADVHGENSRTELSWPDTPESLIIEPVLVDTVPAQNRPKQAGRAKRRTAAKAAISPTMVRKYLCEDCGAKFLTSGVSCLAG